MHDRRCRFTIHRFTIHRHSIRFQLGVYLQYYIRISRGIDPAVYVGYIYFLPLSICVLLKRYGVQSQTPAIPRINSYM